MILISNKLIRVGFSAFLFKGFCFQRLYLLNKENLKNQLLTLGFGVQHNNNIQIVTFEDIIYMTT